MNHNKSSRYPVFGREGFDRRRLNLIVGTESLFVVCLSERKKVHKMVFWGFFYTNKGGPLLHSQDSFIILPRSIRAIMSNGRLDGMI